MKKNIFTLAMLVLLISFVNKASAQFTFSQTTATFTFLANYEVLSDSNGWDDNAFYHAIGFPVEVDSITYDSMVVESNGTVILYKNPADFGDIYSSTDTLPVFMAFGEYISNIYNG